MALNSVCDCLRRMGPRDSGTLRAIWSERLIMEYKWFARILATIIRKFSLLAGMELRRCVGCSNFGALEFEHHLLFGVY